MLLCCVKKWFTNEQASFTMQKLKMIFFIYYNHFLLVFWKIKPCIITGIMQGLPFPIITYQVITGNYSERKVSISERWIITYQVITGNYSRNVVGLIFGFIITYQVITGNYSISRRRDWQRYIITYQVITGNYSRAENHRGHRHNYNIPSNNRELQPHMGMRIAILHYNIPSNNRELQHMVRRQWHWKDYNIPSNNRELQPRRKGHLIVIIITYQVITGNYSEL